MRTTKNNRELLQTLAHPGFVLKEELRSRNIKQKDFASQINLQASHLSEITKGKRPITMTIAQSLEAELGISAQVWVYMQIQFDKEQRELETLGEEEVKAKERLMAFDKMINVTVLMRQLNLDNQSKVRQWEYCSSVLGFSTPDALSGRIGKYHRSDKTGLDISMINTWSVIARHEASQKTVEGEYYPEKNEQLKNELVKILHENRDTEFRVETILSKYGIKYVQVNKLEKASIDGYSYIDEAGIPVIVVTRRFNRIDNYAFAIMHEHGHLSLGHLADASRSFVNVAVEDDIENKEEKEANAYAANALIPDSLWKEAPHVGPNPFAIQRLYSSWARNNSLNHWIVLGRLSYETGMYKFTSDEFRPIA